MTTCICARDTMVANCPVHGDALGRKAISWWTNLPTPRFRWQQSAGICGQHGVYVGPACPSCVTQVKM